MKNKSNLLVLLVVTASLVSCKKDNPSENDDRKYGVVIDANLEMVLGTGEKFLMRDHASFTVDVAGTGGSVTNIQNSPASFEKTQDSPAGCVSTIEFAGTGVINIRPQDVTQILVSPTDHEVLISLGVGEVTNPKIRVSCPGVTPAVNEILIVNLLGGPVSFQDSGQPQFKEENNQYYSIKYTITPL